MSPLKIFLFLLVEQGLPPSRASEVEAFLAGKLEPGQWARCRAPSGSGEGVGMITTLQQLTGPSSERTEARLAALTGFMNQMAGDDRSKGAEWLSSLLVALHLS